MNVGTMVGGLTTMTQVVSCEIVVIVLVGGVVTIEHWVTFSSGGTDASVGIGGSKGKV